MGFCCLVYISVMAFGNKYANFFYMNLKDSWIWRMEKAIQSSAGNKVFSNVILVVVKLDCLFYRLCPKSLCKWKQDSVISFFLYLDSVSKNSDKLIHKGLAP